MQFSRQILGRLVCRAHLRISGSAICDYDMQDMRSSVEVTIFLLQPSANTLDAQKIHLKLVVLWTVPSSLTIYFLAKRRGFRSSVFLITNLKLASLTKSVLTYDKRVCDVKIIHLDFSLAWTNKKPISTAVSSI